MKNTHERLLVPEPVEIALRSIIPEKQKKLIGKCLWVVHKVLQLQAVMRKQIEQNHNGFAPLHSDTISNAVTADSYKPVMNTLKSSGILLCDERYTPESVDPDNAKSKGYKVSEEFLNRNLVAIPADKDIVRRVQKVKAGAEYIPRLNHEKHLKKQLEEFYIDEAIYPCICTKAALDKQYLIDLCLVYSINNGKDVLFIRDEGCQRIFTKFVSMRREYRTFWRHTSGKRLVELDLRNSQPLILCTLFADYFKCEWPEDVIHYKSLCEQGLLYDYLMRLGNVLNDEESRILFKEALFADVFYCPDPKKCNNPVHKARYYTAITKLFEQSFPSVYKLICDYKPRNNHAQLSVLMMRREADLIIDTSCNRLMQDYNRTVVMLTIHDSIVTTEPFAKIVGTTILSAFSSKYSIHPTLKPKYLDTGESFEM